MENKKILETYKEFMGSIIKNDAEEEWIGLENSKKDFENNFKYEKLKRKIRRKYRVIKKNR